jgi:hypothetical protein
MTINIKEIYDYLENKNHTNPYSHTVFDTGGEGDEPVRGHYYDIAPSLTGWGGDENEFETYDRGLHQRIHFLNKRTNGVVHEGIVNEQLVLVLIHRMQQLQIAFPCKENEDVIKLLTKVNNLLMQRQLDRYERNVLGKHEV